MSGIAYVATVDKRISRDSTKQFIEGIAVNAAIKLGSQTVTINLLIRRPNNE
jgi:hypothetical protein